MKKLFKKITVILFTGFFLISGYSVYAAAPGIVAVPPSYDFGDIYQEDGPVSTTIIIENVSEQPVNINRLSTSCGCTTAEMDISPLAPAEKRSMKVTFDPMTHPNQTGKIIRVIYLQTSDPVLPELEIEILGNVIGGSSNDVIKNEPLTTQQSNAPPFGPDTKVDVFFNEACQDCGELVKTFYPEFFKEYGYDLILHDYINERENRRLLNEYNKKWDIPFELQSHIETFVGEKLLIGGHVPESVMRYLLENPDQFDRLLVYQDKMHGEGTDYTVWDFESKPKVYPIDEPITTYFLEKSRENESFMNSQNSFWKLFSVITVSAFLDGINPCAIAVLLFFIAFLFTIKRTRQSIIKMGLAYIAAIYLAYFLIGIGLAQAIIISGSPHLMAYIGSILVIVLGVLQLLGTIFPKFPIRLRIPLNTKHVLEKWLHKATLPAALIGGFLVGLCTFPCSGGIYVAIIGMLAASQSYLSGFGWMVWYNLIFVAPLLILLALAGNPAMTERLQKLERKEAKSSKILIGLTMIALGFIIIFFFT